MTSYFFLTDPQTRMIYLHYRDKDTENRNTEAFKAKNKNSKVRVKMDRVDRVVYKKALYFPEKFEKMN